MSVYARFQEFEIKRTTVDSTKNVVEDQSFLKFKKLKLLFGTVPKSKTNMSHLIFVYVIEDSNPAVDSCFDNKIEKEDQP